jgi:hypothetical protein
MDAISTKRDIRLSTLLSNIANLYSSLRVRDEVSQTYKTPGKVNILCTLQYLSFLIGDC